jgi:hypothetical protein
MRTKITGSTPCVLVGLAFVLAGCGHSSPGPATLSVTCDGSLMLSGASTISAAASGAGTTLSFPDPVNPGQTGTLRDRSGGRQVRRRRRPCAAQARLLNAVRRPRPAAGSAPGAAPGSGAGLELVGTRSRGRGGDRVVARCDHHRGMQASLNGIETAQPRMPSALIPPIAAARSVVLKAL